MGVAQAKVHGVNTRRASRQAFDHAESLLRRRINNGLEDTGDFPLDVIVQAGRDVGDSWETIARDVTHRANGAVTGETLRRWYGDQY